MTRWAVGTKSIRAIDSKPESRGKTEKIGGGGGWEEEEGEGKREGGGRGREREPHFPKIKRRLAVRTLQVNSQMEQTAGE